MLESKNKNIKLIIKKNAGQQIKIEIKQDKIDLNNLENKTFCGA